MKLIEAPIELSTARFEAKIYELRQHLKELTVKFADLESDKKLERERNEIQMAQIVESLHKVELLVMSNEEVQKVTEKGNMLDV